MTEILAILAGVLTALCIAYRIHKKRKRQRGARLYTIKDHNLFLAMREGARHAAVRNSYRGNG